MNNEFEIPPVNGRFITASEARANCKKPIFLGKVKAHLFDLDKFKEFVNKIAQYNGQAGLPNEERVAYVRMYYSRSSRGGHANEKDLVIVPVMASGVDLYKVAGKLFSDDNILSESTPCPNLCGDKDGKNLNCP